MEELKKILEALQVAFAEFKKTNDEELKQIKSKGHADPLLTQKLEKINADITNLSDLKARLEAVETKAARPRGMADGETEDINKAAHKKGWMAFVRKGIDAGLRDLECKAMNITTPADGGFAVPEELDRAILDLLVDANVMRQICGQITIGGVDYKKLINKHGSTYGWVGEADARPETNTPSMAEITPYMGEIYANPSATQNMLDDVFFNVESFLSGELVTAFADGEETAFISGNGTKQPRGFLDYPQAATADGVRAFGTLQYIKTGADGAFKTASATVNPADDLIDLIAELRVNALPGAVFAAARRTFAQVRKFKDTLGHYIWQPSLVAGQPDTLLNYPAITVERMPAIASGSTPIAFGNFKRGYLIVDRIGTRMLRDPFTKKPYVLFYTTKRVGGMVQDSEAIKLLKLSA